MYLRRKNLDDLFIINPQIGMAAKIYIWISDDVNDIKNLNYIFAHCVNNNIYFSGFVTDCEYLEGMRILNKNVYGIKNIMDSDSLILSENEDNIFYCPIKILNPDLDSSNIVIWGAGNNGKEVLDYFNKKNIPVKCLIDSNRDKIGTNVNGMEIYGIEKLETFSSSMNIVEATNQYVEIDQIIQEKFPYVKCYTYSHMEKYFNFAYLMYLKEIGSGKQIYIYGGGDEAILLGQCLKILDYNFAGFLVNEGQVEKGMEDCGLVILPEELLYFDNYYVLIVPPNNETAIEKLEMLGLRYSVNFSSVETLQSYLLYARKNIIDINLGHTYKSRSGINGVDIYGSENLCSYRVVVLGGSTTDGTLYPFKSWPELMYNKICNNNIVIYNAGVSGYTSSQELLKLIRDMILLKPDMIIVYDGYNDSSEKNAFPGRYFEFSYLKRALDFAQKNISHKWDYVSRNASIEEENNAIPVIGNFENWLMNIETMHAIAVDRGIKFYSFLQPMLSSKKNLTKEEKGILFEAENFCGLKKTSLMGRKFRNEIGEVIKSHCYIYDLSDIFDNISGIYMDICHVREGGNEIIASEILKRINLPL